MSLTSILSPIVVSVHAFWSVYIKVKVEYFNLNYQVSITISRVHHNWDKDFNVCNDTVKESITKNRRPSHLG